jgi:hypothetical protein
VVVPKRRALAGLDAIADALDGNGEWALIEFAALAPSYRRD